MVKPTRLYNERGQLAVLLSSEGMGTWSTDRDRPGLSEYLLFSREIIEQVQSIDGDSYLQQEAVLDHLIEVFGEDDGEFGYVVSLLDYLEVVWLDPGTRFTVERSDLGEEYIVTPQHEV